VDEDEEGEGDEEYEGEEDEEYEEELVTQKTFYWVLMKNKSKKQIPGERKLAIDLTGVFPKQSIPVITPTISFVHFDYYKHMIQVNAQYKEKLKKNLYKTIFVLYFPSSLLQACPHHQVLFQELSDASPERSEGEEQFSGERPKEFAGKLPFPAVLSHSNLYSKCFNEICYDQTSVFTSIPYICNIKLTYEAFLQNFNHQYIHLTNTGFNIPAFDYDPKTSGDSLVDNNVILEIEKENCYLYEIISSFENQ
jgi:hypothetical protein